MKELKHTTLVTLVAVFVIAAMVIIGSSVAQALTCTCGTDCPVGDAGECVGTQANDIITGTSGADHIDGLGGNDTISGLGDDDIIDGNLGNDIIDGEILGSVLNLIPFLEKGDACTPL